MNKTIIILIFLFISTKVFAISIENIQNVQKQNIFSWYNAVNNPAIEMHKQNISLSQFYAGYVYKNENVPFIQQLGSGASLWKMEANSFIVLSPRHSAWGSASYTNGKRKSVNWNSTSDYELLYPYVMADSIGGDINFEEYRFAGGYGISLSDGLQLGTKLNFRAMQEYRGIDPRPRNLITDLGITLGASYNFSNKYALAVDATLQKYKQSNSVTFLNELGKVNEFQMLGFGNDYQRFSGRASSLYHKGSSYGGELSLFPLGNGLIINLSTQAGAYTRTATSLNAFPLTILDKYRNKAILGYSWRKNKIGFWINGEAILETKNGKENIAGDASSSIYPVIGTLDMFQSHDFRGNLNLKIKWNKDTNNLLWIMPKIGYIHYASKYKYPANNLDISKMLLSMQLGALHKIKYEFSLNWHLGIEYSKNVGLDYNIGNSLSRAIIQNNIDQASADLMSYNFHMRSDYTPKKWEVGLFIELAASLHTNSVNNKRTDFLINTGITF